MPKILVDLISSLCFFSTGVFLSASTAQSACGDAQFLLVPFVCALPLWFRFQQCMHRYHERRKRFPDVANACKYALSEAVVVMGSFHPLYSDHSQAWDVLRYFWLLLCVVSSLYAFSWDITMDWGLIRKVGVASVNSSSASKQRSNWFGLSGGQRYELRKDRMFPYVWCYYAASLSNLVLRFCWTVTIVPFAATEFLEAQGKDTVFLPLLYFLELYRRFQWGIFRGA